MTGLRNTLIALCILIPAAPAAAQCTVGGIIDQMATSTEALEFAPVEGTETLDPPGESPDEETPVFVFTPEIRPDQRRLLRQVGQACAWTSDVSNCTFRRVARMALHGRDAAFIYDRCSD